MIPNGRIKAGIFTWRRWRGGVPCHPCRLTPKLKMQFVAFSHLIVEGTDAAEVAARARDVLLRELVKAVGESRRPPRPSRPVESDGRRHAIVVNPL